MTSNPPGSTEQFAGRRTRRSDDRGFGGETEVGEDAANGLRLGDRGEQLASPAAAIACEGVNQEHPLQEVGP